MGTRDVASLAVIAASTGSRWSLVLSAKVGGYIFVMGRSGRWSPLAGVPVERVARRTDAVTAVTATRMSTSRFFILLRTRQSWAHVGFVTFLWRAGANGGHSGRMVHTLNRDTAERGTKHGAREGMMAARGVALRAHAVQHLTCT